MSRSSRRGAAASLGLATLLIITGATPAAFAEPEPADGPIPGAPVIVEPGDTFAVEQMRFTISDSLGIAAVENGVGGPSGGGAGAGETTVRLDATVLFGRDSARIDAVADVRLTEVAEQLRTRGPGALTVTGYTDDLGPATHGLLLSRRRAAAVTAYLRRTLPASDFPARVIGRGEADPEVPNDTEAHRRLNRRVIVVYRPG